jgi:hypothetical protein
VATHGRAFTGTHCLLIENRVDPIVDQLEKVLLANPEKVESDSATKEVLHKFRCHFLLMGKNMFSLLLRTPRLKLQDDEVLEEFILELQKSILLMQ